MYRDLNKAFGRMKTEPHKTLSLRKFLKTCGKIDPNFNGERQQDAEEFLRWLLTTLDRHFRL